MNPMVHIRRLRWLPRAALAIIVLATIQVTVLPCAMAAQGMTSLSEHCAYCPPAAAAADNCSFPHAPTVDVFGSSAHQMSMLFHSPLLQPATFDLRDLRQTRIFLPAVEPPPPRERPLTLTHCVQLK